MAPAITSVWPFKYFVALWITTSAPCSSRRKLTGEAKVESTSRASPSALHSVPMESMSRTRITGLVGVSTNTARVFFLSARFQDRDSRGLTKETSIPRRPNSWVNSRYTPP